MWELDDNGDWTWTEPAPQPSGAPGSDSGAAARGWLDLINRTVSQYVARPAPAGVGQPGARPAAGGMSTQTILIYLGVGIAAILLVRAFTK